MFPTILINMLVLIIQRKYQIVVIISVFRMPKKFLAGELSKGLLDFETEVKIPYCFVKFRYPCDVYWNHWSTRLNPKKWTLQEKTSYCRIKTTIGGFHMAGKKGSKHFSPKLCAEIEATRKAGKI